MNTKNVLLGIGVVVVAGIAVLGLFFPRSTSLTTTVVQGISNVGASNSTSKLFTITSSPSTDGATTSSILNTDGTDRAVTSVVAFCTGVASSKTYLTGTGLAAFTVQMSTSTSAVDAKANTNYVASFTIATSSSWSQVSSTTPYAGAVNSVWPTNTYLNITYNATNTASCTIGAYVISL